MSDILYKVESFEGPLDLLLHLIQKHKLNIYEIKISELLEQYMQQIKLMRDSNLEVSSEFLEMASKLLYIKTVSLLPKQDEAEKLKEELTGQLLEYQECKRIAELFAQKINLDFISRSPAEIDSDFTYKLKHQILELANLYNLTIKKKTSYIAPKKEAFSYIISRKIVSVFFKAICILRQLVEKNVKYSAIFTKSRSKSELIASFLAILELIKTKRIEMDEEFLKLKIGDGKNWRLEKQRRQ